MSAQTTESEREREMKHGEWKGHVNLALNLKTSRTGFHASSTICQSYALSLSLSLDLSIYGANKPRERERESTNGRRRDNAQRGEVMRSRL